MDVKHLNGSIGKPSIRILVLGDTRVVFDVTSRHRSSIQRLGAKQFKDVMSNEAAFVNGFIRNFSTVSSVANTF